MKIFINAGHGGNDPGAVSKKGTKEADITKKVSSLLACQLIQKGFDVEYFQQKKSFTEVSEAENASKSDLFISIHCNSWTDSKANGVEVLHYPTSTKGIKLARLVQELQWIDINKSDFEAFSASETSVKDFFC